LWYTDAFYSLLFGVGIEPIPSDPEEMQPTATRGLGMTHEFQTGVVMHQAGVLLKYIGNNSNNKHHLINLLRVSATIRKGI
jgi:hypothetical protein